MHFDNTEIFLGVDERCLMGLYIGDFTCKSVSYCFFM